MNASSVSSTSSCEAPKQQIACNTEQDTSRNQQRFKKQPNEMPQYWDGMTTCSIGVVNSWLVGPSTFWRDKRNEETITTTGDRNTSR